MSSTWKNIGKKPFQSVHDQPEIAKQAAKKVTPRQLNDQVLWISRRSRFVIQNTFGTWIRDQGDTFNEKNPQCLKISCKSTFKPVIIVLSFRCPFVFTVLYFGGLNVIGSCAVCSTVLISEARISYENQLRLCCLSCHPVGPKGTVSLEMFRG